MPMEKGTAEGMPMEKGTGEGMPMEKGTAEGMPMEKGTAEGMLMEKGTGEGMPMEKGTAEPEKGCDGEGKWRSGLEHGRAEEGTEEPKRARKSLSQGREGKLGHGEGEDAHSTRLREDAQRSLTGTEKMHTAREGRDWRRDADGGLDWSTEERSRRADEGTEEPESGKGNWATEKEKMHTGTAHGSEKMHSS